jgi:hypothetical protein
MAVRSKKASQKRSLFGFSPQEVLGACALLLTGLAALWVVYVFADRVFAARGVSSSQEQRQLFAGPVEHIYPDGTFVTGGKRIRVRGLVLDTECDDGSARCKREPSAVLASALEGYGADCTGVPWPNRPVLADCVVKPLGAWTGVDLLSWLVEHGPYKDASF